jgi:hypothetical protein
MCHSTRPESSPASSCRNLCRDQLKYSVLTETTGPVVSHLVLVLVRLIPLKNKNNDHVSVPSTSPPSIRPFSHSLPFPFSLNLVPPTPSTHTLLAHALNSFSDPNLFQALTSPARYLDNLSPTTVHSLYSARSMPCPVNLFHKNNLTFRSIILTNKQTHNHKKACFSALSSSPVLVSHRSSPSARKMDSYHSNPDIAPAHPLTPHPLPQTYMNAGPVRKKKRKKQLVCSSIPPHTPYIIHHTLGQTRQLPQPLTFALITTVVLVLQLLQLQLQRMISSDPTVKCQDRRQRTSRPPSAYIDKGQ